MEIGKRLSIDVAEKGYGSGVVKRLSADLTLEFPDLSGFSPRNLWNMKNFYEFYQLADEKVQQRAALLPWRDFNKLIAVAELAFDFPEKEIRELINREVEAYELEKIETGEPPLGRGEGVGV